jgi:hypothetical protein
MIGPGSHGSVRGWHPEGEEVQVLTHRAAIALAAVLLVGLTPQAVAAGPSGEGAPSMPIAARPFEKAESRTPHLRGHVDLQNVRNERDRPTDQSSQNIQPDVRRGVDGAEEITAAPPTVFATSNSTPSPSLTKLGAVAPVGNSNFAAPIPTVSVGPDHVVRSDQAWFQVSNRTGGATQVYSFEALLQVPASFDPGEGFMWYVPSVGRWLAMSTSFGYFLAGNQVCNLGTLDFAISDTANPTAGWTVYYYAYPNAGVGHPRFGTSSNKFAFTVRIGGGSVPPAVCGPGTSDGVDLTINEWADVIGHDSFTADYFFFPDFGTGGTEFLVPSIGNGPNTPNLEVLASEYQNSGAIRRDWLLELSGPVPGVVGSSTDLTTAELIPLIGQPLPNSDDSEDATRARSAVLHDKRLLSVGTERCTPNGDSVLRNCVRVIDIDTSSGEPAVRQDFYLAAVGKDTFGPGLAVSDSGELVITYQRSSYGTGASAYIVRQAPTDAVNTVSAPRLLQATNGPSSQPRASDFVGASPDPVVSDAVWVTNNVGSGSSAPYLTQTAQARTATGDTYTAIDPVRILDTRDGTGLTGVFTANVPRTFNVAGAAGGLIPANAVAVTGNVTVANQTAAGYLALGPISTANPTSSTINFPLGDIRGNNFTLPLDGSGDLAAVYKAPAGKTAHVIVDITGYFLADDTAATYHPVSSARILDSRAGKSVGLSGRFNANVPRSFAVTGRGGIPAGAIAVTGNLTVTNQTRAGYVSLGPISDATPETSSLNFPLGDNRGNGITVALSDSGSLWGVYKASSGTADLIFDVTGYYTADATGLRFYPLNPARIMDTRYNVLTQLFGKFVSSTPRTLVTGGHFGVPGNALAVTGNLSVVGQSQAGYVAITLTPNPTPPNSSLNFPYGDIRGNGVTVPLNGSNDMAIVYKAGTGATTHLILDLTGYFR